MKISKKMKKYYLIIPILALMLGSCQREGLDDITSVTPVVKPPQDVITGSIVGYVVDENQVAIKAALVSHDSENTTYTNAEGKFVFTDIELYKDGSLLTISKDGFFQGSNKFYATDNNVVQIQLSSKTLLSDTEASTGGRVDINDAFIILPGGSYLSQGEAYDGKVNVYGQWINPADRNDSDEMPGDLTGYNEDGDFKAMTCFSMLKVSLEDISDDELSLPEEQSATINFPIPDELLEYVPEEISLWYFDEVNGSWIEEGIAILESDRYVGEVTRIAAWACGIPSPHVEISATFLSDGELLSSKKIKLLDSQTGYISYLTTNENGQITTRIPIDSDLDIEIDHTCSNQPLSKNLGSFPSSQELTPIDIPNTGLGMMQVQGVITNCNGGNNANAYLKVDIGDSKFMINTQNGEFDLPFNTSCADSEISVIGIDLANGKASQEFSHSIREKVDFEQIPLCDDVQSGYNFSFSHMNWATELENEVRHSWTVRTISSTSKKIIFNPRIVNEDDNDIVYLSGAFAVIEGSNVVHYVLRCESQGFNISGTCEVSIEDHSGFDSYRFFNPSANPEITETNSAIFPADSTSDIDMIDFDLVYYD